MDDHTETQLELAEAGVWLDEANQWECLTCGARTRMHTAFECARCHESRLHYMESNHG